MNVLFQTNAGSVTFLPSFASIKSGCGRTVQISGKSVTTIGTSSHYMLSVTFPTGIERFCGIRVKSRGSNVECPSGAEGLLEAKIPNPQRYQQLKFTNLGVAGETYTEADNTLMLVAYGQFACASSNANVNVGVKYSRMTPTETIVKTLNKMYNYDSSISLETGVSYFTFVIWFRLPSCRSFVFTDSSFAHRIRFEEQHCRTAVRCCCNVRYLYSRERPGIPQYKLQFCSFRYEWNTHL